MKLPPASTKASRSLKDAALSIDPMKPCQASPMLMAPSCRGDTRMPAVDERIRYRPSSVAGSGAGMKMSAILEANCVDLKVEGRVRVNVSNC
jgi:hypothetical protein